MAFQKMTVIKGQLVGCGRSSSLIVGLLVATLGIKAVGCDMLEVIYPPGSFILKEGDSLTLNCTVRHQQNQSSQLKAYWCKYVEDEGSCARVGKERENLPSTEHFSPQVRISLSLQIQNVSRSDSGGYQCRASMSDKTAVGHFIRVKVAEKLNNLNTTGNPEAIPEGNRALRMGSWLEKIRTLIMIFWITLP